MELFNLRTRIAISSNLNCLLTIKKMMQMKNPKHDLIELVDSRLEEMEEILNGTMEISAELRLARQRNFDLENLVSKLQNDLMVERNLNNHLMQQL